jgi:hypothetical protein
MATVGLIVRMDNTGLGNQTRALCEMLKPDRIMVVDSTSFNGSAQHLDWYDGYNGVVTVGWPNEQECNKFMLGLTHVLTAETVYNNQIFWLAKKYRVKVFVQPNWEFLDHLVQAIPQPHTWLMPSYWHLDDMKRRFRNTVYLPPPIMIDRFEEARRENIAREGKAKFLHIVGKRASHDRNGTEDLLKALAHSTADFSLTVRSQTPLEDYGDFVADRRVTLDVENVENEADMYKGFDALIFPRRYAGLSLPMNEALASALPVIMPHISPNNQILPQDWLVPATVTSTFVARTTIDVHTTDAEALGKKIDEFALMDKNELLRNKMRAYEIAKREFSPKKLLPKYKQAIGT